MSRRALALVGITIYCIASATGVARADDWLRFRGPNGAGHSETAFNAPVTEKDFAWKVALPGTGHSSPVVRGDRIYLTCGDTATGTRIILCLGTKDGSKVWQRDYPSQTFKMHNDNSYASATPAVDDVGVYVCWTTPQSITLLALGHDGKELWKQDLGSYKSNHGSGASPMVVDDLVIMTNDQEGPKSSVVAFDHKTGKQRWKIDRESSNKAEMSTPCLFTPKGGKPQLILSSKATGVTAVDPKSGSILWQVPNACPARTVGSAAVTDEMIVQGCGDGTNVRELTAIRVKSADGSAQGAKPEVAYQISKIAPYVPTPIVKGDLMYMWGDNGVITCVKVNTGETVWQERVGGQYYGSPVCAGDTLWCISRNGKLVGVAAADKFKPVGEVNLGEPSHSTPAVAGGRMYLRTVSHLICVGK